MSESWNSQQRHWCKYCKKYVANNKPSISLHENGRAHKDEVERFLRGVYSKGRQDKEDAESVKLELQRIERAALQSIDPKDRHKYASSSTSLDTSTRKTYNYYIDPTVPTIEELRQQAEEEKRKTEMEKIEGREEWAVNKEIAKVGEWETVVSQPVAPLLSSNNANKSNDGKTESTSTHDQKPEFQDDDHDEEGLHGFKIKEKELDIPVEEGIQNTGEEVTFKKRKLGDSAIKSRKKKPLRKKD